MFDCIIIGGGVIGTLTARALLKYKMSVCIVEKHASVGSETSKANSAIVHAGYDCLPGSNKARFNPPGNRMMEEVCRALDVSFNRCGSLVLAFSDEEMKILDDMRKRGQNNGVPELSILTQDEVLNMEPNISTEVKGALFAGTAGIISSYKLALKAAENAKKNGATIITNAKVTSIKKENNVFTVTAGGAEYKATYVINAAGVFADEVAAMAGDTSFSIYPRKGEYILYDKKLGNTVNHVIFQTPFRFGKGILVAPTMGGPLLIGPTAHNITDKEDTDTTEQGIQEVFDGARKSVPSLTKKDMITTFAGLRAISNTDDFIIGESPIKNFINAAGIQSPGLSASPAIAEYIAELVNELHGGFAENESFDPANEIIPDILKISDEELTLLIQKNPAYARIICRCETVTEAAIKASVASGQHSIDGVKLATRAGMGRCSGGFCMPKVLEIIAEETGRSFTEIMKNDDGSYILLGESK